MASFKKFHGTGYKDLTLTFGNECLPTASLNQNVKCVTPIRNIICHAIHKC